MCGRGAALVRMRAEQKRPGFHVGDETVGPNEMASAVS